MKTRIFLIAVLFAVTTAFYPAAPAASSVKSGTALKKKVWKNYCGNISAGCNGNIEVKIASDLSTAYLLGLTVNGVPLSFSTVSISPVAGSPGVFAVNVNYTCNGVLTNYTGGAYTAVCP
ncbi:hypothetical protein [Paraflavitalea pollutisoli]|uniref:hypothetical protein n=1 Tax=Paraflavitalea pollutisoli TaxID=3034143 RepID=UPI0023ED6487|nr:hypothetical protein [Paraflavitalea sp. H1-2-19X]